MNVLVLGATGRTGKPLIDELLARGYTVHAVLRDIRKLTPHPQLLLFEGSPADAMLLENAMRDCEAIISTLNISRTSDFPWAPLRTPQHFLSDILTKVVSLASGLGMKRIIVVTAWGTHETKKDLPAWFRWVIDHSNVRYPYKDHERQEDILKKSILDWTVVRPVGLSNSKKKEVVVSLNGVPRPRLMVSRKSVAGFLVDVLRDGSYGREMPVVFN